MPVSNIEPVLQGTISIEIVGPVNVNGGTAEQARLVIMDTTSPYLKRIPSQTSDLWGHIVTRVTNAIYGTNDVYAAASFLPEEPGTCDGGSPPSSVTDFPGWQWSPSVVTAEPAQNPPLALGATYILGTQLEPAECAGTAYIIEGGTMGVVELTDEDAYQAISDDDLIAVFGGAIQTITPGGQEITFGSQGGGGTFARDYNDNVANPPPALPITSFTAYPSGGGFSLGSPWPKETQTSTAYGTLSATGPSGSKAVLIPADGGYWYVGFDRFNVSYAFVTNAEIAEDVALSEGNFQAFAPVIDTANYGIRQQMSAPDGCRETFGVATSTGFFAATAASDGGANNRVVIATENGVDVATAMGPDLTLDAHFSPGFSGSVINGADTWCMVLDETSPAVFTAVYCRVDGFELVDARVPLFPLPILGTLSLIPCIDEVHGAGWATVITDLATVFQPVFLSADFTEYWEYELTGVDLGGYTWVIPCKTGGSQYFAATNDFISYDLYLGILSGSISGSNFPTPIATEILMASVALPCVSGCNSVPFFKRGDF